VGEPARGRRLTLLGLLLLEALLFSGPFVLGWLYVEWHQLQGLPQPARIPFLLPMLLTGVLLAVGWVGYDVLLALRRWRARRPR
jgi:hypothetical protein